MPSSHHTSRSPTYVYESDTEADDGYHRRPLSSSRTREYRDRDDYDRKSSRKNSPRSRHRESSMVKIPEHDDTDAWDTDYDPKDKYYLSAEDDPYNLYAPERKMTQYQDGAGDLELPDHDRKHSSPRRHHHHSHSDRHDSADRRKPASDSKPKSSSAPQASRPRPRTYRAGSSYTTPSRPRAHRAGSSYTSRPRMNRGVSHTHAKSRRPGTTRAVSHGGTGKSVRTKPRPVAAIPWGQAATCALEAGAVAAIKASHAPGPLSQKGAKVVTAALGAAVVDTFLSKKMPKTKGGIRHAAMREVAEAALGNFVVGPVASGGGRRRRR